jgi:acyl carrier protein
MVQDASVYDILKVAFHVVFEDNEIALTRDTTAQDAHGWDSLTNIRLMTPLERRFNIKFSASEIANLRNVGDLADLIASKL